MGQWNIVLPCEFTSKVNHICPGQKWNTLMTSVSCRKSRAVHWHSCPVPALGHTGVVTCLTGQDNETRIAFCAVLALKAFSLESIVCGLISTEPGPFTVEKATGSGLDSVAYTKCLNKSSRTALGEYPARHFIKCLQTDAFQAGSFKELLLLYFFLMGKNCQTTGENQRPSFGIVLPKLTGLTWRRWCSSHRISLILRPTGISSALGKVPSSRT